MGCSVSQVKSTVPEMSKGMLGRREKLIIKQSWEMVITTDVQVFYRIWLNASRRNDTIREILNYGENETKPNARLQHIAASAHKFFDRLITTLNLENDIVGEECRALGRLHYKYAEKTSGFQSFMWDIFIVCFTEILEQCVADKFSQLMAPKNEVMYTWQKFVHAVVAHMRTGFFEESKTNAEKNVLMSDVLMMQVPHQ